MAQDDEDMNIESLKRLKKVFEEADEDGSGELDIHEFIEKLGPYLGSSLSKEAIAQLFMKIDADAGGTVDWDEFTNYMFLERAQQAGENASENWRLFPQDFRDRNDPSVMHRGPVDKIYYCDAIDKYISCGRDGTFRLWNGADLRHHKTITMGSSWITDCLYMPLARKLVFTTVDRAISYYEANRGSFDLSGRVYASGSMGVPQSLSLVTNDAGEQLVYGDSKGAVLMLLCGTREWPARDMISTDEHQDYIYIHQDHRDWVSQVQWVPEIGLVSSSLDSTIKVYDFVREKVINTCTHHLKGVHAFVWCKAYSMFASCGQERDIILWQGNTMRRVGELTGHTASVSHIALDERLNHVFTLSVDKVIKVWDLRNHKCLQTIMQDEWIKMSESHAHCLTYDPQHRRVITAASKPYVWVHKMVAQDRTGHMEPVRGALYNNVFSVVVSVDEAGTVCVWNIMTGSREGRFTRAHGDSKVTACCFDVNERRLLTAANDGSVKIWNFNNGSLLRQYKHNDEQLEVSCVVYAADEKRSADAVYAGGWNCKVFVWQDDKSDSEVVSEYRVYDGHREDILHIAACQDRQLLATGDYEGRINIYNLFTGEKRMSLFHRAERYETSVERLEWVVPPPLMKNGKPASSAPPPLLLLSCGGDGLVRVWLVGATGKLLCTMHGAHGRLEVVTAITATHNGDHVIIGDTAGHVRVWDISAGVDVSSMEACRKSFKERVHWRPHTVAINSLSTVPEANIIIVASKDCNISLWSFDAGCVGVLGESSWQLDNRGTWLDPSGANNRQPLSDEQHLYLQVADELEEECSTVTHTDKPPTEDDVDKDYSAMQKANLLLANKKVRQRDADRTKPQTTHAMLRVHDLQDVPSSALDLLRPEGAAAVRKKATRVHAGAGKAATISSAALGTKLGRQPAVGAQQTP